MQGHVQKGDDDIRNCHEARAEKTISYGSGSHEGCAYRRQFTAKLRRAIRRAREGNGTYEQRSHRRLKRASSTTAGGPREYARAPRSRGYSRGQTYGKDWRKHRNNTDHRGRRMIGRPAGPRSSGFCFLVGVASQHDVFGCAPVLSFCCKQVLNYLVNKPTRHRAVQGSAHRERRCCVLARVRSSRSGRYGITHIHCRTTRSALKICLNRAQRVIHHVIA